jgi:ubiquinone/menaquinone biosynthesis C-methylase UbiE
MFRRITQENQRLDMNKTHTDHAKRMETGMKLYLFPQYKKFRNRTVEICDISPDENILDFGCGVGLLEDFIVPKLSDRGKVVGVDIGKELIDISRMRFALSENCEFRMIDSSGRLPFPAQYFDLIVTNLVFHLLDKSQKKTVLNEFLRVLKPRGRLVMVEIGRPTSVFGLWIKFLTLSYWAKIWPYEINSIDSFKGEFLKVVHHAGFRNIRVIARMRGYIDFIICSI